MARPVLPTFTAVSVLYSTALLAPTNEAHQIVLLPEPQWTTQDKDTKYNPLAFLEDQGFETQEDFTAWRSSNYDSLRAFMDNAKYEVTSGADFSCGFTDANGTPQPIPANGAFRSTGYTHDGPCEAWIGDKKVMEGANCHEEYPGKDHTLDYSSCEGTCILRWYWLGVRNLKGEYSWQVYKNCIPLIGSGGGGGGSPDSEPSGSPASQSKDSDKGPSVSPTSQSKDSDKGPSGSPASQSKDSDKGPSGSPTSQSKDSEKGPSGSPTSQSKDSEKGPTTQSKDSSNEKRAPSPTPYGETKASQPGEVRPQGENKDNDSKPSSERDQENKTKNPNSDRKQEQENQEK